MKKVKAVHAASFTDYNGLDTYRVMPSRNVSIEQLDPFIFMNHHGPQDYIPANNGLPFGPHPHKGFETVTFILQGDLVHKDNTGFSSNIKAGGVQWMTAGRGIIHSETSSEDFKKNGGMVEILQLWVNLPSKYKLTEPGYIGLQESDIPVVKTEDGKARVQTISGTWGEKKAPVQSISDVTLDVIHMDEGGAIQFSVPENRNILFYVVKGSVTANGALVETNEIAEFELDGTDIRVVATEPTKIIFGHAKPTGEPIVANGPFVMNTEQEIGQAYDDYNNGNFGEWQHG